jgi:uncharacterized protein YcbX
MTPVVARLTVYPFKSLDGIDVAAATLTGGGALRFDRAFALVDEQGAFVNGKREPRVHELRVAYALGLGRATFTSPRLTSPLTFVFDEDPARLATWLCEHFERPIAVSYNGAGGFPDDTAAPGPTVVSTATLIEVASWFPGLGADGVRRRLRANIEIGGVPAFWEDGLYTVAGEVVAFRVGEVTFEGMNPCARCVVPSRDPITGAVLPAFAKTIVQRRAATLPTWAEKSRFDHYYRLTVNTRADAMQSGRRVRVGDALTVPTFSTR